MVSAEALVRWQKPGRGLILPNDFIPLMEKNGFVPKLDYTIWEEVCSYLAGRQREKKRLVPVSVNISRLDIHNPKLLESIVSLTKNMASTLNICVLRLRRALIPKTQSFSLIQSRL